jgi:replicative DNA helicase
LGILEGYVKPIDFYNSGHQKIYATMLDMEKISFSLVLERIVNKDWFTGIGDTFYKLAEEPGYKGDDLHHRVNILLKKSDLRQGITLCSKYIQKFQSANGDSQEVMSDFQNKALRIGEDKIIVFEQIVDGVDKLLYEMETPPKNKEVLNTGLPSLDSQMDFSEPGLITIAGRPGSGKSSIMRNWAASFAKDGNVVGIFTPEMSKKAQ